MPIIGMMTNNGLNESLFVRSPNMASDVHTAHIIIVKETTKTISISLKVPPIICYVVIVKKIILKY
jgi:hypothetical protein